MKKKQIIISCGGTGGHIFPGIEIAKSLRGLHPELDLMFVGSINKMEMNKVPEAGFPIIGIWIQALYRRSVLKNILFFIKLVFSLIQSIYIVFYYRPAAIIGTGGFASGPVLFVGSIFGFKTYIQEQNCYPGLTNKLLGKIVDRIFVAYNNMDMFFPKNKIINFGNPVRHELRIANDSRLSDNSYSFFGLCNDKFTILIVGGSLGAEPINLAVQEHLEALIKDDCQLIWQTGETQHKDYAHLQSKECSIVKFIDRMDLAYAAADIVISRAGAIAITEISLLEKASILIPSPHVTDNHQFKNAKYLLENDACILIPEADLLSDKMMSTIQKLKNNIYRKKIEKNVAKLFKYNASFNIAELVLRDIENDK